MEKKENQTRPTKEFEEVRSPEVQEILSYVPHWVIRWGITVFFGSVILLLIACWFIRYPDMIPSRIVITNENPPASIVARSSGRLMKFVKEDQQVKKGDYLAIIGNTASNEDILQLRQQMDDFRTLLNDTVIIQYQFNENLNLGELQGAYANFLKQYKDYQLFFQLDYHKKQIASISQQIAYYRSLNEKLESQRLLTERETVLARKKYRNDSALYAEKVIPQAELDRSETAYLQQRRALQAAKSNIISNNIQVGELEKRILDLMLQDQEQNRQISNGLEQAFDQLKSQLAVWENQYALKAPLDGKVAFFKFWSDNQFVNVNDEIMTVVASSSNMFGMVQMPVYGSGKVQVGQNVKIKLDNYPHEEYGLLEGRIDFISPVPRENMYSIKVKLVNGLVTNYKKNLEFREEMQGSAEIVTENLRLIERIFHQFRSVFKKSLEK
jgi:multidrug resistance efflux pump